MKIVPINKDSSLSWTPEMTLLEAMKEYENGIITGNKMIVIALDDENGQYITRYRNAGMKGSEILAVLEVVKATILRDMIS